MTTANTNTNAAVKKLSMDNGNCCSNTGYRRVVFAPNGYCRPVITAVRSGYQPGRHTVQTCEPGDIIIIADAYKSELILTAQTVTDNEYNGDILASYRHDSHPDKAFRTFPDDLSNFRFFLQAIELDVNDEESELAYDFLMRSLGRRPSFLPAGLGWDGVRTLGDINKENRIRRFFAGVREPNLEAIVKAAMISKKDGLPQDWSKAEPMPRVMDAPARSWDGSAVNISMFTAWVLITKQGKVTYIRPEPTSGEWGSNYAHSDRGEYNAEPMIIPSDVTRAIKLTFGAYIRDYESYGITWELFKR